MISELVTGIDFCLFHNGCDNPAHNSFLCAANVSYTNTMIQNIQTILQYNNTTILNDNYSCWGNMQISFLKCLTMHNILMMFRNRNVIDTHFCIILIVYQSALIQEQMDLQLTSIAVFATFASRDDFPAPGSPITLTTCQSSTCTPNSMHS